MSFFILEETTKATQNGQSKKIVEKGSQEKCWKPSEDKWIKVLGCFDFRKSWGGREGERKKESKQTEKKEFEKN